MNFKSNLFDRKTKIRVLHDEYQATEQIAAELIAYFSIDSSRPIVAVCIGTDRSTGDSLGPLVGTLLGERNIQNLYVYGTLDDPIHAVNLAEKLKEINDKHKNPFIIGIDACLGRVKSVGMIEVGDGPVKPGAGVNKDLPEVGDIHITGIVNVSGFMEFFVLQNTRLNLVLKMAKAITECIYRASLHYPGKSEWIELDWKKQSKEQAT